MSLPHKQAKKDTAGEGHGRVELPLEPTQVPWPLTTRMGSQAIRVLPLLWAILS